MPFWLKKYLSYHFSGVGVAELQECIRVLDGAASGPEHGGPARDAAGDGQAAHHGPRHQPGPLHPLPAAHRQRHRPLSPHHTIQLIRKIILCTKNYQFILNYYRLAICDWVL